MTAYARDMTSAVPERDPSSPESVAQAVFSTKRKGLDPDEVRSFLVAVAAEFERLNERIVDLEHAVEAAAKPITDLSGLDDATMVSLVGDEAARVLRTAREEAALVLERADESASRRAADAAIAAERVVREATEAARRERTEVKARLREMIDEAERHVERVRMRAERSRESARLWALQAEHAQREVADEFKRARQAADDVIAALAPQLLTEDLDELPEPVAEAPVVADSDPVEFSESESVVVPEVEPDDEIEGGEVVQLFAGRSGVDVDDVIPTVDEPSARDIALVQILPRLIRRAKRTFTDEQKLILAALDGDPVTDVSDLIPGPDEHGATHSVVLRRDLGAAAVAGAERFGAEVDADAIDISEAVSMIETVIAGEIRRRLENLISVHSGDNPAIAGAVRAMYRDLRRDVVDSAVTDAALCAYSIGMLGGAPGEVTWRWVPAPDMDACAECADDVLAGSVSAGSPFPTGHLFPPAHPGCRCDLDPDHR